MTQALKQLEALRRKIDAADKQILAQLAKRARVSRDIGKVKRGAGMPILQPARWTKALGERLKRARKLGLHERYVKALLAIMHKESLRIQKRVRTKNRTRVRTKKR